MQLMIGNEVLDATTQGLPGEYHFYCARHPQFLETHGMLSQIHTSDRVHLRERTIFTRLASLEKVLHDKSILYIELFSLRRIMLAWNITSCGTWARAYDGMGLRLTKLQEHYSQGLFWDQPVLIVDYIKSYQYLWLRKHKKSPRLS